VEREARLFAGIFRGDEDIQAVVPPAADHGVGHALGAQFEFHLAHVGVDPGHGLDLAEPVFLGGDFAADAGLMVDAEVQRIDLRALGQELFHAVRAVLGQVVVGQALDDVFLQGLPGLLLPDAQGELQPALTAHAADHAQGGEVLLPVRGDGHAHVAFHLHEKRVRGGHVRRVKAQDQAKPVEARLQEHVQVKFPVRLGVPPGFVGAVGDEAVRAANRHIRGGNFILPTVCEECFGFQYRVRQPDLPGTLDAVRVSLTDQIDRTLGLRVSPAQMDRYIPVGEAPQGQLGRPRRMFQTCDFHDSLLSAFPVSVYGWLAWR